mmetsp:Transcript_3341/g.14604  ORF Transcript_3341/g.14604 Transcript_3341/m.14604 type:complete len:301 (+) Transcript_3341:1713-2615(+)
MRVTGVALNFSSLGLTRDVLHHRLVHPRFVVKLRSPLRQSPFSSVVPHYRDVPRLLRHHRVDEIHRRVREPEEVRPPLQMFLNLLDPRLDLRVQRGDLRVPSDSLHEVMRCFVPARHVHQEVVAVRVRRVLPSPRPNHVVELDGRRRIQAPRAHHLAQVHELGALLLPVRALVEERSEPVVQRDQRGVLLVQEVVQSAVLPERGDEPRSGLEVQPEEPRELGFGFVPLRLVLDRDENLSLPVRVAHAFHLEPIHRLCIRGSLVGFPPDGLVGLLGGCGAVCGGRGRRRRVQPDFHAAHEL